MWFRKAATAAVIACLAGAAGTAGTAGAAASATGTTTAGTTGTAGTTTTTTGTTAATTTADPPPSVTSDSTYPAAPSTVDVEFVNMMIPHHFQALVMSDLAPSRSTDQQLLALANRIDVEQGVEIASMRGWQARNGLPVTDPQAAYEMVLQNPDMLEQMGMATPAQLEQLGTASGNAFDVLFLELMIRHHQGAVDMTINVISNGSDPVLQQMATDMMTTQYTQIQQMEAMLAGKTHPG